MVALEKFMKSLKLTTHVELDGEYIFNGKKHCCVHVFVWREETDTCEFEIFICFSKKINGELKVEDINIVQGVEKGVLSYLSMNSDIHNYFVKKAADVAEKYL